MVTLDQLKKLREKEQVKLKGIQSIIAGKLEKQKVKQEIRSIKAARFRGQLGITKEGVEKMGNIFKGSGKGLLKLTKVVGKGLFAVGQSANEYYEQEQKRSKRRR